MNYRNKLWCAKRSKDLERLEEAKIFDREFENNGGRHFGNGYGDG